MKLSKKKFMVKWSKKAKWTVVGSENLVWEQIRNQNCQFSKLLRTNRALNVLHLKSQTNTTRRSLMGCSRHLFPLSKHQDYDLKQPKRVKATLSSSAHSHSSHENQPPGSSPPRKDFRTKSKQVSFRGGHIPLCSDLNAQRQTSAITRITLSRRFPKLKVSNIFCDPLLVPQQILDMIQQRKESTLQHFLVEAVENIQKDEGVLSKEVLSSLRHSANQQIDSIRNSVKTNRMGEF